MFCAFAPGARHNAYARPGAIRGIAGDNNTWLAVDGDKCSVHLHQVSETMLMHVQEQCGELLQTTTYGSLWMVTKFCAFVSGVRDNAYTGARGMRGTGADDNGPTVRPSVI